MPARAERTTASERPTQRTPTVQRSGDMVAPSRRHPAPFGPTMLPADVLALQRTMGNRAVARMLAPTIQREPDPSVADEDVVMVDAAEIAAQHTTAVGVLSSKADRIIEGAEAAETEDERDKDTAMGEADTDTSATTPIASTGDVGSQLDGILAEADTLETRIARDAEHAEAAGGDPGATADATMGEDASVSEDEDVSMSDAATEDASAEFEEEDEPMPDASSGEIDRKAEPLPDGALTRTVAPTDTHQPIIQLARTKRGAKTEPHDDNYLKRARKLTTKEKTSFIASGGIYKGSDLRDKRRKLKSAARRLDKNKPSKMLYDNHISKKTGTVHPIWKILSAAVEMYSALDELKLMKEHVRWFQHTHSSGYVRRSMRAVLVPGKVNFMIGSNTGGTSDLYFDTPFLNSRKNSSSRPSSMYIKGHLLNDNLGGAGLAHNLVPLTAEKVRGAKNKSGSNDANGEHNKQVEEPIKKLLTGKDQLKKSLTYRVDSLPPSPDPARLNNTRLVRKYADAFNDEVDDMGDEDKKTTEVRDEVEQADTDFPVGIGQNLLTAIGRGHLLSLEEAASRLIENAELWETENTTIPAGILCTAHYMNDTGTRVFATTKSGVDMNRFPITNILPTKFTAAYKKD